MSERFLLKEGDALLPMHSDYHINIAQRALASFFKELVPSFKVDSRTRQNIPRESSNFHVLE
ncbi:hypothetical protein BJF95_21080 [Rhizobium oryziradicis]|uniref:Uncharacterized protein n=1 Tax=Rhizobium oryziradicis TaxID=1867956 RepID=A0A1Q8ZNM5_9HYPH|nr:hypothetical protein BJF95_21080 [Rhizobium oryziradicis]